MSWLLIWIPLALCAVAVVLKLTGLLTWNWWWVLAPLWTPWVLAGLIVVALGAALLVVALWEALTWR